MERMLESLQTTIPAGRTLRIRHAAGSTLSLVEGTGWITEEDDPNDYTLEAGDSRQIGTKGLTLVHASRGARIVLERGMPSIELGTGYNEYAAAVWVGQMAAVARRVMRALSAWASRATRTA